MTLSGEYGETPVSPDDIAAFTRAVREHLGDTPTKAELFDVEQEIELEVEEDLLEAVLDASLDLPALLSDSFVRELHRRLYAEIWSWGGRFRVRELNLGVAPEAIAGELRGSLDTLLYRWDHTTDWSPRQLGIAAHAEVVRIHPFVDGNGRSTRLLGQLVFIAAQPGPDVEALAWDVDKTQYVGLLRRYDVSRDPSELAAFIPVRTIDEP